MKKGSSLSKTLSYTPHTASKEGRDHDHIPLPSQPQRLATHVHYFIIDDTSKDGRDGIFLSAANSALIVMDTVQITLLYMRIDLVHQF